LEKLDTGLKHKRQDSNRSYNINRVDKESEKSTEYSEKFSTDYSERLLQTQAKKIYAKHFYESKKDCHLKKIQTVEQLKKKLDAKTNADSNLSMQSNQIRIDTKAELFQKQQDHLITSKSQKWEVKSNKIFDQTFNNDARKISTLLNMDKCIDKESDPN